MEISVQNVEQVTVVKVTGDIDSNSAPVAQEQIMPLATPGSKLVLDMAGVKYMSSAGLRVLLSMYRQAARQDGSVVLVGLAEEIKDTMSITGFINFFTICDSVDDGLKALA
jgi:anti-sigma B factor antagonist